MFKEHVEKLNSIYLAIDTMQIKNPDEKLAEDVASLSIAFERMIDRISECAKLNQENNCYRHRLIKLRSVRDQINMINSFLKELLGFPQGSHSLCSNKQLLSADKSRTSKRRVAVKRK